MADHRCADMRDTRGDLPTLLAHLDADADGRAWAAVESAIAGDLRAAAQRTVGVAMADDVVQEALLRLRRNAASFRRAGITDGEGARRWCIRVAVNTARGMRLRMQRRRRHERMAAAAVEYRECADPVEAAERTALLRDLISRLPPHERRTVEERFLAGRSTATVARAGDLCDGAVRWRLRRALARLRDGLRRSGYLALAWLAIAPRSAGAATTRPCAGRSGACTPLTTAIVLSTGVLAACATTGALFGGAFATKPAAAKAASPPAVAGVSREEVHGRVVSRDGSLVTIRVTIRIVQNGKWTPSDPTVRIDIGAASVLKLPEFRKGKPGDVIPGSRVIVSTRGDGKQSVLILDDVTSRAIVPAAAAAPPGSEPRGRASASSAVSLAPRHR